METARYVVFHRTGSGTACRTPAAATGRVRRLGSLAVALFIIWVFMFVVAPLAKRHPWVAPLAQYIDESGIDARALYYTEIDETSEAEMYLADAERFSPEDGREN